MSGAPITVRIAPMPAFSPEAPALVIEGAQWLAETFFRRDPSAVGASSFDAWIRKTQLDPARTDRILDDDVTAVNSTMAARTSHVTWAAVIAQTDWRWLSALSSDWDLIETSDQEWGANNVPGRLRTAFHAVQRPSLQIAVVTKVLHIKRPRLVPVLDSLVISQIGARYTEDVAAWVAAMEHLRTVGRANLEALVAIRAHLEAQGIHERPLIRVLWTHCCGLPLQGRRCSGTSRSGSG